MQPRIPKGAPLLTPKAEREQQVQNHKRNLILDAAMRVVSKDGFQNARLEDIAEEAGFAKASLYYYYPDKESLVLHLILREQNILIDQCSSIVAQEQAIVPLLEKILLLLCDKFSQNLAFHEAIGLSSPAGMASFAGIVSKHSDLFIQIQNNVEAMTSLLVKPLKGAQDAGILRLPFNPSTFEIFLRSIIQSIITEVAHNKESRQNIKEVIQQFIVFLSPWIQSPDSPAHGEPHA
jgi:AcrR family transcriptional regulator